MAWDFEFDSWGSLTFGRFNFLDFWYPLFVSHDRQNDHYRVRPCKIEHYD